MSPKTFNIAATLLSTAAFLSGCTLPEAGSSTPQASARRSAAGAVKKPVVYYHEDPPVSALLRKIDGAAPEARKKAVAAFRTSLSPGCRARQKSCYILARILQKAGTDDDLRAAIPLYEEASSYPPLFQRSLLHVADCAYALKNESLVRKSIERMHARASEPLLKARVDYILAQSYMRTNEEGRANQEFNEILKLGQDNPIALSSLYYLGQLAFKNNNIKEGLKLWREYIGKNPDGRFAREIVAAMTSTPGILSSDQKLFANVLYAYGDWDKALQKYKDVGAGDTWFKQADCLFHLGRSGEAKELLLSSFKKDADADDVARAASLLARMGSRAEAISVWQKVLDNCPACQDRALYNLAYRAPESEALTYYKRLVTDFPDSDFAPESYWWIIWNKIKEGKTESALADLKKCAQKYDIARQSARFNFWIGKLEEKQDNTEAARKAYQQTAGKFGNSYYAWRARARLQALAGSKDPGFTAKCEGAPDPYKYLQSNGNWTWPAPPSLLTYKDIATETDPTIACLSELQQWDECLDVLPQDKLPELRSLCLVKLSMVNEAINLMAKSLRDMPVAGRKWEYAYPLLHARLIKNESSAKQVDPLLTHSLIRQESRYNSDALSCSNAIGLMQLLPGTAMGVAKKLGLSLKSNDELHKPECNIKLGTDYLSGLISRFKGNAMLAVASYNGGPTAVSGWTRKFGTDDPDEFVENIPYTETRDYVREVFGGYWNYSAIYTQKGQPRIPLNFSGLIGEASIM